MKISVRELENKYLTCYYQGMKNEVKICKKDNKPCNPEKCYEHRNTEADNEMD